jgi:gliding motility associated protien GldN
MHKVFLLILTSLTLQSFSQLPAFELPSYHRAVANEGRPIPHRYLGESRVKFSKRIHRVIDGRQKQNKNITWPKNPLNILIWTAVTKGYPETGQPTAYKNDSLTSTMTVQEVYAKASDSIMVPIYNPATQSTTNTLVPNPFDPSTIKKFRLMEDWIFDAQHSDLKPRIIAIAPLYTMTSQSGIVLGETALFWVKMDELRRVLAQQEIFNTRNDAARMSYDQWFKMRLFASHIVKESNVYDLDIAYQETFSDNGVEALLESDRIKNDLFVLEHDLWAY